MGDGIDAFNQWDYQDGGADGAFVGDRTWVDCGGGTDPDYLYRGQKLYITFAEIRDGTSNTIFVGEKHVPIDQFGRVAVYDNSIYNADYMPTLGRFAGTGFGMARRSDEAFNYNFGSYHPGTCQFALGDGSVRSISISIDGEILNRLANRKDRQPIPADGAW